MIEPLLWTLMCVAAIAMCWAKVRSGAPVTAMVFAGLGISFGLSGWSAFQFLLEAMNTYSAGLEVPPFKVTLLVGGPLAYVLGKPSAATIAGALPWIR